MYPEAFADLAAKCEAATSVAVVKGYPVWGRPAAIPPIISMEAAATDVPFRARVGEPQRQWAVAVRFGVFARNEPELWGLLEKLMTLLTGLGVYKVGLTSVSISFSQGGLRHPNENQVQEEAYAFIVPVTETCQGG